MSSACVPVHNLPTPGSHFRCRRPTIEYAHRGNWLHVRVLHRIFQALFRDCQIYTNDHDVGYSLGELSILNDTLLRDLRKQSANSDEFHCLIMVSLALLVHVLGEGVWVEHFRRLGGVEGHPVSRGTRETKLRDRRGIRVGVCREPVDTCWVHEAHFLSK